MLSKQYSHRLPVDYDVSAIRRRAAARGPMWDDTPGLYFKSFSLREAGKNGAPTNVYSSIYLWKDAAAAADFLTSDRFDAVLAAFGRPGVEMWLPLDVQAGPALQGRWIYREDLPFGDTTDMGALRDAERERNQALAQRAETVAAVTALDPAGWKLVRLHITSAFYDAGHAGDGYEVLHLAQPLLGELRK
ncbi:hypothetical protein F506_13340 [Herbaspirillum hiltneri N3]|uniref:DUF4865 domain-containing protein n=1 Tax=Herbaspirillum hiltneri N3 TaxID=1262470 RepID=A0ABM5V1W0_9BURK|nr:DUF4865 family protein [Herbaspirillum hiltneri]AKZ63521.1 hypothetical protein F506_13340 [Herbaspirillum hiltneri N3]